MHHDSSLRQRSQNILMKYFMLLQQRFFFAEVGGKVRLGKRERSHNILVNSFPLHKQNHYSIITEMSGMVRQAKRKRSHSILMNSFPLRQQNNYSITTESSNKLEEREKSTHSDEIICAAATKPLLAQHVNRSTSLKFQSHCSRRCSVGIR